MPEGWGLLEVDLMEKVTIAREAEWSKPNRQREISVLYSIILRKCGKSTAPRKATIEVSDEEPRPILSEIIRDNSVDTPAE
jgi:hypothetical protein